jgi:putative redox protein
MSRPTRTVKKMKWIGGLQFEGTTVYGKKIVTDSSRETGGQEDGFSPSELVLFGLAGCTGIDVLLVMQKQKQKITSMEIELVAHQNEDYPRPFNTIEVKFIVKGENIDERKLFQAIELSQNKYCVVSQTLKNNTKIKSSYEIVK